MKNIIVTIVMLLFGLTSLSQETRIQTFRLSSLNGTSAENTIHYCQNDTILHSCSAWSDGTVIMRLDKKLDKGGIYLAIRQDETTVYRIKLDYFDEHKSIVLPFVEITLVEDRIVKTQPDIQPKRSCDIEDFKIMYRVNPDNHHDFKRYFPIESLTYSYEGYFSMMSDSSYYERFYDVVGRYPTDHDIDSLVRSEMKNDSEFYENWCSLNLYELKEPVLFEESQTNVYRFTWFINNGIHRLYEPYSIRIEPNAVRGDAIMYFCYRYWDFCEEFPIFCDIIPIEGDVYRLFMQLIGKVNFWEKPSIIDDKDSFAGSYLNILEANINGQYHVIFRGDGEDEGMEELREFLWGLTGLGENKIVHRRQRIE